MKLKTIIAILTLILLISCVPDEVTEKEKLLSSGVQYLGNQEKIITELERLKIEYENPTAINLNLDEYKLLIIEPNYIEKISRDQLLKALEENYYVFFINLEDSRLTQEAYLGVVTYDDFKRDKLWAEQLYLEGNKLKSLKFSTEPNWEDELLNWLQYFDKYKLEND